MENWLQMETKGKGELLYKARSEEHNETKNTEKLGKNGEDYEKKGEIT